MINALLYNFQVRHVDGLEYYALYYEFMNFVSTVDEHRKKMDELIYFNEFIRYAKPSNVFKNYCKDYIENAIVFLSIDIGAPFFTVYERDISANFFTKIAALGNSLL